MSPKLSMPGHLWHCVHACDRMHDTWFCGSCCCCCCISCVTVLSRLPCRSPAASWTSTSGLLAIVTASETLVSTGVVRDVAGVDGVMCSTADDSDSLEPITGKHDVTDPLCNDSLTSDSGYADWLSLRTDITLQAKHCKVTEQEIHSMTSYLGKPG